MSLSSWRGFANLRTYSVELQRDLRELDRQIGNITGELARLIEEQPIAETVSSAVTTDTQVVAGAGLTGGGALSSSVTLNVGAGTGITVAADTVSISASFLGANPTASVGLAAVNGVATTYMRSDGAPALSQSIAPTWTGTHTFSLESVHNGGIDLGTSGVVQTQVVDGATIGLYFQDTIARTTGDVLTVRSTGNSVDHMEITWDGRFWFGYGAKAAQTGVVLGFFANDSTSPSGAPILTGIYTSVQHSNTAETASRLGGVGGQAFVTTATGLSATMVYGMLGSVACNQNSSFSGKVAAGVVGRMNFTNATSTVLSGAFDAGSGLNQHFRGAWDHVTMFWADCMNPTSSIGYPTAGNRALITSSARLPIQDHGASTTAGSPTGQYWAVYGEHKNGSLATFPTVTGYIRMTYPRRTGGTGVRAMHAWWEPWPNTTTIRAGNVVGDTYFDDGTNFQSGLWQRDNAGWVKLLTDDLVLYDDEIVTYEDDIVVYH